MYVVCDVCGMDEAWAHDHKPDGSGLDDGPPLPRSISIGGKRSQIVAEWKAGATLRALSAKYDVSHETVRGWTETETRTVGAPRRPKR